MEEKKYPSYYIVIAVIITAIVCYFIFNGNNEIDYKNDDYVQDLIQEIKDKEEQIRSLQEKYDEIQGSIDALRDDLQTVEGDNYLIVKDY